MRSMHSPKSSSRAAAVRKRQPRGGESPRYQTAHHQRQEHPEDHECDEDGGGCQAAASDGRHPGCTSVRRTDALDTRKRGGVQIGGERILLVGQCKGRDTTESIRSNWGMLHPEGYRKALAKMRLAEKFGLPIVTFIDTKGAYPGVRAEVWHSELETIQQLLEVQPQELMVMSLLFICQVD